MKYKIYDSRYWNIPNEASIWSTGDLKDNYKSRSSIGKKAYKTFLKNGGSRNSKGQFSKKEKIDWEKIGNDMLEAWNKTPCVIAENTKEHTKAYAKVFQKHGLIDKGVEI